MRHLNLANCELRESPSGENFRVVLGRHTIAVVEIPAHGASDPHFHKEREESYYFISGTGLAKIANQEKLISAGDLIYASPSEIHQFLNLSADPLRYMVITAPCWVPEDSFPA